MKTEKILAMIYRAAEQLQEEDRKTYQFARENPGLYDVLPDLGATLGALAHQLEEDATKEAAKKGGRGGQYRALGRVVSSAIDNQPGCPGLHGTVQTASGARAVCDGYRAVRISNPDTQTPRPIPENVEPMDLDAVFSGVDNRTDARPAGLPDAAALRVQLEAGRAEFRARTGKPGTKYKALWAISAGPVTIYANAQFLLDMLEALPGAECSAGGQPYAPLYFIAPDGDGLLLPVNRSQAQNLPIINRINTDRATE